MRNGASVNQERAVSTMPRGARITRSLVRVRGSESFIASSSARAGASQALTEERWHKPREGPRFDAGPHLREVGRERAVTIPERGAGPHDRDRLRERRRRYKRLAKIDALRGGEQLDCDD